MTSVAVKNGNGEMLMKRNNEKGSALLFALILMLVLSSMAASLFFLSQSETWSSVNYRMMTQARYGAEAGINAVANFLMSANYVPPAAPAGGIFAGYNTGVYPVQTAGGANVVLTTIAGQQSTYPDGPMVAAFQNAMNANQPLQAGANNVNYSASAQLMSMVSIMPQGTTLPATIQTWQITAHGDISNVRNAEAQVVTTLERYISPAFAYAAFADGNGCGQLTFSGNGTTNGYDSAALPVVGGAVQAPTAANLLGYGGNVGTNGNETDSGANVKINGTLSSPNAGFGVCGAGGNMTALSGGNQNQISGGLIQLPQAVTFLTPAVPPPGVTNVNNTQTLAPGNWGDINLAGNKVVTLTPGVYNINSISITGNAQLAIAPDPITGLYGPVIVNVTGNGNATPIDLEGKGIANSTYDPSIFQFMYGGAGQIKIAGNGSSAAVVYAPNATASFKGNGTFYGSVIASQLTDVGNGAVYYDMKLRKKLFTIGNYVLNSFTWDKY